MGTLKQKECNEKEVFGFCLMLFSDTDELQTLWIPVTPHGFYRFSDEPEFRFVSIEEKAGSWVIHCSSPAYFRSESLIQPNDIPLKSQRLLEIECEERQYYLYIQPVAKEQMSFQNYSVISGTEICIGSHEDSDIYYDNEYCADRHAVLLRSEGKWYIRAIDENRGVYINCCRVAQAQLQLGDMIYIMGLRVIVGSNYLSISGTGCNVTVSPRILREFSSHGSYFCYSGQAIAPMVEQFFHRLPRKRLELEQKTITVEGPPMSMEHAQMPLMLRMGSSMVMGGAAALAGNFTTMLSSVLFPFLSSKYNDKQKKEYEACRVTKYHEYLDAKRAEIEKAGREEHRVQNEKFPALDEAVTRALQKQGLWERRPIDTDFLTLRLGAGILPMQTTIAYPERRFSLDSDPLEEEMYQMVETEHTLTDMPITLSLTENTSCGLLGSREFVLSFLRQMILQIAIFHSYDEVKMVFLVTPAELEQLKDIRFLPHVWDDQQSVRFVATNESEAYRIGEYLQSQLPENLEDEKDLHQILKKRPYYIVFSLDKKLFDSHTILKDVLQAEEPHGVSVISVYDNLPKECQKIIRLSDDGQHQLVSLEQNGGQDIAFRADKCSAQHMEQAMRMLANTKLKTVEQEQSLPKMVTFLEMFRAGTVEQLNSFMRWKENNPVSSLSAPVGVSPDGSWFTIDLHEKRQGPHGLVAGMIGSGKSEFLISYILSMAVNYHPNEVAFVLIDYKGGGLAGAFENPATGVKLPHLVGTITNLDGATIQRSLMSIESELRRRQRVFNEVKSQLNEGTMDIYAYQKLYRAGKISEPMPHLFIISDEFAELKQQQPEFIEKLISAARIGRSLGVHLILATQKPSGVVNDQIRSNTKFRVCLRVQERSDSMDMLKRPEAAELTDTGRFYLQVGYNEYFAMGQSAWCGAAYEPQTVIKKQRDDAVEFLDITGQTMAKAKPKGRKVKTDTTQLVAVVKYLSDLAAAQGLKPEALWPEELSATYDLEELQERFPATAEDGLLPVCLGMLDDPENQEQFPLKIDFAKCQNMLISGTAGSGKTTMLQDILFTLAKNHSAEDVQFYILDYSSRTMKLFRNLPHCGAVLLEEDSDSLDRFFDLINGIVAERKKLFSELEVDSFEAARAIQKLPVVLVVIDNFAGLTNSKPGENHSYRLPGYLKDCANYGIKYLISCTHLNEIPSRAKQGLAGRICLHMKDKYEYSEALNAKCTYNPPEKPGRGMYVYGERPLEFQAAICHAQASTKRRSQLLKDDAAALIADHGYGFSAKRLPVMSETATYEEFAGQFGPGRIPLGYSKKDGKPVALPLRQLTALNVYFGNLQGVVPVLGNLLFAAKREGMQLWVVKRAENSIFDSGTPASDRLDDAVLYSCDPEGSTKLRSALTAEMSSRRTLLDQYCAAENIMCDSQSYPLKALSHLQKNSAPIFLVFESFADFCRQLDSLSTLLYDKILSLASQRNIYITACFEPDDDQDVSHNLLYSAFSTGGDVLLFGGQINRQTLCDFPDEEAGSKVLPYNLGIMKYRDQYYPLLMPCGELAQEAVDEDDQSVF